MSTRETVRPEKARSTGNESRILVVDDDLRNREFLQELLETRGYRVEAVEDGPTALWSIRQDPPHVVILDVMMPGMTGFEVCRKLKADPELANVPVLMVTALSGRDDRIQGIEAGADDFLNKPVDRHEVLLRVRNAVQRSLLYRELKDKHERLQDMEALRDSLTHMLVHDMRTPLTAVRSSLELLDMSLGDRLDDEECEDLRQALGGVQALADMVSQVLVVSRGRETELEIQLREVQLQDLVEAALAPLRPLARKHRLTVDLPDEPVTLACDPALIRRTISNLFGNAVKFVPEGEAIRVGVIAGEPTVRIEVEDTGPGIPAAARAEIFERFSRGPAAGANGTESSGLGLTFCKMVAEAHGGGVGVDSEEGRGSTFWVELPRAPESARES